MSIRFPQARLSASLPDRVRLVEVGPRDGLQAETQLVSTDVKIELINRLAASGIEHIEATSFVSPKWVPQLADASAVMAGIKRPTQVEYSVLVPNMRGFEAAIECDVSQVVIFASASEAFSERNINCSVADSIKRFEPIAAAARETGVSLRGGLSCCFGCPYQGEVDIESVLQVIRRLRDLGCDEIDIADTIGVATPAYVQSVLDMAAGEFPITRLSGHFHDTYGQALANILAALEVGVSIFHSSVAGLGGCPYAKGATGNVATEDVLYMLEGLGIDTGIDLDRVVSAGQFISNVIGRPNGSRAARALLARGPFVPEAAKPVSTELT